MAAIKRGSHIRSNNKCRGILRKRRARLDYRRPANNVVKKRVRTLRRLVPNSKSMGLDALFREAADYVMWLQMRVEVMQVMVHMFSGSED